MLNFVAGATSGPAGRVARLLHSAPPVADPQEAAAAAAVARDVEPLPAPVVPIPVSTIIRYPSFIIP
jgi:hypothetical protein